MKEPRHILVVTGWSWKDPLIQVYTLPYVRILRTVLPPGSGIRLATMEQPALKPDAAERRETKKRLAAEGITWIPLPYRPFGLTGLFTWAYNLVVLLGVVLIHRISVVHAWCMPAGALGLFLSWAGRSHLVIDSYEPHAEPMVENGTWKKDSFRFRLLFALEKRITRRADAVIAVTEAMKNYARQKYASVPDHFYVKPACIDLSAYASVPRKDPPLLERLGLAGHIVGLYAGKFGGIYLEREVFDFFKSAEDHWGQRFRLVLLSGHPEARLREWAAASGLDWNKVTLMKVTPGDMPLYLGLADFAITPVKPVPTKRYCTPIKDGEYWAAGLPVVITQNISDDSDLIRMYDAGAVLERLDKDAYDAAVKKIDSLISPARVMATKQAALMLAREYRDIAKAGPLYARLYATLFPTTDLPPPG